MSGWIVYSKDGSIERCKLRSLEYGGTAMGERAVTATFDYHSEVAFEVFDYIEYRGERFELEAVPTVKKLSSFEYQYELRFVSLKYELERCEMRDLVPSDNGVVYPTPLTFSFTGDVRYLTDRIQACLDAMYGTDVWKIIIADGTSSEEKNITIAQQNCWNALALVNSTYGLNFYIKGRTITIGGEQPLVSHTFEYGKGNGLYEIERASDTETGIVTKLRAYGSTRNLDYSYPKKPEWSDSVLPVSFALSPLRLMLPSFKTDGKTDYVLADEAAIAKYGIREASMVYDDIYPSIAGATYNGQAVDEIKAVDAVDESQKTFVVYLHELGFDLEEHLTTSDAQISMKSGALQGYTFTISAIEKQTGGYKITLGKNSLENSEESGAYVPGVNWNMKAGDKFVLLNILMPQKYIRDAENRLLARANEYLAQYSKTNFSYNIGLHDKFLIQNPSVYDSLIEGSKLKVYDKEIGIDEEVTIQSITITENLEDNILPQVKVTLNNEPSASTIDRIQGKLNEVAAETAANGFTTQSEIMAQYRRKLDKPFFDKLFVAIDANGNEIASTDVITPIAYIKAKYHVASVGGFTMYAMDKDINIPSLASGLPFDGHTIWYNPDTQQIEVIGGTGGGSGEGVSNFWDLSGIPSWITISKPKYTYSEIEGTPDLSKYALASQIPSLSGYATESWVLQKNYATKATTLRGYGITDAYTKTNVDDLLKSYVTLGGTQTITGEKNFTGGLKVNGSPIIYDSVNKYWKLQGNLVLTGGITMYADDGTLNLPSIYDGLPIDGTTIYWDTDAAGNRVLKAVGGGGTADSVAWNNITGKPSWIGSSKPTYSYSEIQNTPDLSKYALQTALDTTNTEVAKKWTKDNSKIANWDSAFGWGNHANAGYVKKTYVDETFVNLTGEQTISGKKNFSTGGLFVNGSQIKYDSTKKYWKLEGDLLVTGGITMYGNEGTYTPSTIMDAIAVDGVTISKSGGVLKVIGGTGGGVADSVAWSNITGKPNFASVATSGKYDDLIGKPTLLSSFTDDVVSGKYLPLSGGTITGTANVITINRTDLNQPCISYEYNGTSYGSLGLKGYGDPFVYNASNKVLSQIYHKENISTLKTDLGLGSNAYTSTSYLPSSSYTAADILTKLKTVDGSGSGLDADLLDGKHLSDILSSNVASANKLQTAKTIWGQSFDGTGNVSGALSDVTGITFKNDYYGLVIDEFGNFSFKKHYSTTAADWSFKDSLGNKLMIINNSGNVGIGTANPLYKLHIYSTANQPLFIEQKFSSNWADCIIAHNSSLSSGQHYSLCIGHSDTTKNRGVLAYYHNGEGSDNNRLCFGLHGVDDVVNVLGNGRVGIGTTSPTSKLEVSGIVKANYYDVNTTRQASLANSYTLGCGMYGSSVQHSVSNGYTLPALMWSAKSPNGNSSQFSIMSYHPSGATGYLIIGVAKNGTRTAFIEIQGDGFIQAGGDFLASGGITMYSDQRKKTILSHVELSLKQIANAPLIEHYYNSDEKKTTHVGSIAQYWASMNDWFCKLDSEGFYTMEIQNAALASAISIARELDRYETKTDKAIKTLKKRICELEEEIERLKSA